MEDSFGHLSVKTVDSMKVFEVNGVAGASRCLSDMDQFLSYETNGVVELLPVVVDRCT